MRIPEIPKPSQPPPIDTPPGNAALKARISGHVFDKPAAKLPFSERLARENGWPLRFALRVIEEYRRFVYLACIAGEEVTPSDEVDQVWHLHLAYSRDYWERFCPKVLGRPLHHGPTDGGAIDQARFEDDYRRTLALYRAVFGFEPPPDIWPPAQLRFGYAADQVRVNRALFALAPKTDLKPPHRKSRVSPEVKLFWALFAIVFLFDTYVLEGRNAMADGVLYFTISQVIKAVVIAGFSALGLILVGGLLGHIVHQREAKPGSRTKIAQPQHGYTVTYTVAVGAGAVVAVAIDGDGSGDGGDGEGGGGCGGCGG